MPYCRPVKVTIITPTLNSEPTINGTLRSIYSQTYPYIEHIVVDGQSSDDTLSVIQAFYKRTKIVTEKAAGIYKAINTGIKEANGEIIGVLHSDDCWANDQVVAKVVQIFEQTGCDAVYGDLIYVAREDDKTITRKWIAGQYTDESLYSGWMPPHPALFIRKEIYHKLGLYDERLKISADYSFILKLLLKEKIWAVYLPEILVHMKEGGESNKSTGNRLKAHIEDSKAWKFIGLTPRWYTVRMKPIRKIPQFLVREAAGYRLRQLAKALTLNSEPFLNPALTLITALSLLINCLKFLEIH